MYTIKEAASRSGVSVPLLRAWERRYGVVQPIRTAAGYRLYDEDAIRRLTAMRQLIASGFAARQAAERLATLSPGEIAETAIPEPQAPQPSDDAPSASGALIARLVAAAREVDAPALESALDEIFGGRRFEWAADEVLMPALRAIGDAWARDEVSVAGEHAASQAVLRRLAMAYEAAGDSGGARPVLVGLGPGARHEFGAYAFATALRRSGVPVLYLGPDLPVESWRLAAEERDAPGAVIAVPRRADAAPAEAVLRALRADRPEMLLAVGGAHAGRVARDGLAIELPARMADAVERLRLELGGR
jgi:DNA-binding transcriptional MerR regulator/methylmalonyl-CoA mutase cobalamin-binding subunit